MHVSMRLVAMYFNPHSRKGSDETVECINEATGISIHTPARGVTKWLYLWFLQSVISIHTPARGVTYLSEFTFGWHMISIHTPARGVTAPKEV